MADEKVASETPATPASNVTRVLACVPVKIVLAEAPFPLLALYALPSVPRPGDLILVGPLDGAQSARVEWVNFRPLDVEAQVQIGVSFKVPVQQADAKQSEPDLEKQVEKVIEMNARVFEKATAYSNVMMLAGYAGIFAIWSFVKPGLAKQSGRHSGRIIRIITDYICDF